MIPSLHGQYLKGGGYLSFPDWVDSVRRPDWLQYEQVADRYRQIYGPDSVRVMAYECLTVDPMGFIDDVCACTLSRDPRRLAKQTVPTVNQGISRPTRWVFRQTNRLFRRSLHNDRPVIEIELRVAGDGDRLTYRADRVLGCARLLSHAGERDRALLASLLPTFREGNARLAARTGLPLAAYGYPLPAPSMPDGALRGLVTRLALDRRPGAWHLRLRAHEVRRRRRSRPSARVLRRPRRRARRRAADRGR